MDNVEAGNFFYSHTKHHMDLAIKHKLRIDSFIKTEYMENVWWNVCDVKIV